MPACAAAETERLFQHQPTVKVSAGISVGLLDLSLIPPQTSSNVSWPR